MTTLREAAQQALEAMAYVYEVRFTEPPSSEWRYYSLYRSKAQVEAMLKRTTGKGIEGRIVPLYANLTERHLTDEVIAELWHKTGGFHHKFARAVEQWLRTGK